MTPGSSPKRWQFTKPMTPSNPENITLPAHNVLPITHIKGCNAGTKMKILKYQFQSVETANLAYQRT